ncbi:MAG TPA: hypothetical protein VG408_03350 [Actinomycetota bacterium]|nr:hypothetical protein [Actinomycetota bacterium]
MPEGRWADVWLATLKRMRFELAHTGGSGAEVEMLSFGIALMVLAFLFRPSQVGGRRAPLIVTLVLGAGLVAGSLILPRV